jgi:hypothetical protein
MICGVSRVLERHHARDAYIFVGVDRRARLEVRAVGLQAGVKVAVQDGVAYPDVPEAGGTVCAPTAIPLAKPLTLTWLIDMRSSL